MYHMFLIPPPLTVTTLFYPCSSTKQVLAPYKSCSSFIKVPTVKKTICPTGRPRWHLTKNDFTESKLSFHPDKHGISTNMLPKSVFLSQKPPAHGLHLLHGRND